MGDEQLSYLGYSYGTVIGQVYADLFPERVRSMVLDGVVRARADRARARPTSRPPASRPPSTGSWSTATPPRAAPPPGDTLEAVEEVLAARRGAGGIPADGRRPRRRARRGEPGHQLRALLAEPLERPSATRWPMPLDGDGSELVELADGYLDIGDFEIYFAVNCLDFAWPIGDPDAFFAAGQGHRRGRRRTSARRS